MLASLSPFSRVTVDNQAGFERYEDGVLRIVVRTQLARDKVVQALKPVDFHALFQGFRSLDVRISEEGRTGREARAEADVKRRDDARAAAESSPAVRRLIEVFGARLDDVVAEPARDTPQDHEDDSDEQSV